MNYFYRLANLNDNFDIVWQYQISKSLIKLNHRIVKELQGLPTAYLNAVISIITFLFRFHLE